MNRTAIEYLDYTWNPIVGCSGVGCAVRDDCWARGQAKRRKHECQDCYEFKPHYHLELYEDLGAVDLSGIPWIIIGGQTRPKKLPEWSWIVKLTQSARAFGVRVFIKNNLKDLYANPPFNMLRELPEVRSK